jgi:hypothetical protein
MQIVDGKLANEALDNNTFKESCQHGCNRKSDGNFGEGIFGSGSNEGVFH